MNLKLRLNLIITVLLLFVLIAGSFFTFKNARINIQAEVSSTAVLALHMLDAEIAHIGLSTNRVNTPSEFGKSLFHLNSLNSVRHLKIEFFDAKGSLKDSNRQHDKEKNNVTPIWFAHWMDSVTAEMPITKRRVYKEGHVIGELMVTPDPSYEISEIWEDTKGFLRLMGALFIIANILIYWAVSRGLKPIDDVISALTELELGHFSSRLPTFTLPELTCISRKFNTMAKTLEESRENNKHLAKCMISLQEDERKNLARELHDEIGQHLTAIHIDAAAIEKTRQLDTAKLSAKAIDEVVQQMMDIVHSILQRFRPNRLDELGSVAVLQELIDCWKQRNTNVVVTSQISNEFSSVSEQIVITVYRLVQECLTNVTRYANASSVKVLISRQHNQIVLTVNDNGLGFNYSIKPKGFGLLGMRERVEGLSGSFEIITAPGKGTQVEVALPCI